MPASGFEELNHTADWSIRVWAATLEELFAESARGMNTLTGATLKTSGRLTRLFEIKAPDPESLLVAFLSEMVYAAEQENLGFDIFEIEITNESNIYWLHASFSGAPLHSLTKFIKAVTFHNLNIQQTQRGYEVEIVFDV